MIRCMAKLTLVPALTIGLAGCEGSAASLLLLFPELGAKEDGTFTLVERRVVLLVSSSNDIALNEPDVLFSVEEKVAELLHEHVEDIDLVPLEAVRDYRLAHQHQWGTGFMAQVGNHFRAQAVVEIRFERWQIHQGPHGRHVYQGRTDGICRTLQSRGKGTLNEDDAEDFTIRYPTNTVRLVDDVDRKRFRRDMIDHVVAELGPKFYRHKSSTIF